MSAHQFVKSAILLCALGAAGLAVAAGNGAPKGVKARDVGAQATVGTPLKLLKTVTGVGNGLGASLTAGFNTIDERTVNCTVAAGCAIGFETMAQLKPQGADWAICLLIDGSSVSCQYQGHQASTSGFVVGNARGIAAVAAGAHTVTTQLYTEASTATYTYYQTDYRLYK